MKLKILFVALFFLALFGTANAAIDVNVLWDGNYVNDTTLVIPFHITDDNSDAINDLNISIYYGTTASGEYSNDGGTTVIADQNAFDSSVFNCSVDYATGFRTTKLCSYSWSVTGLTTDTNYTFDVNVVDWNSADQARLTGDASGDTNADSNSIYYDTTVPDDAVYSEGIDGTITISCNDYPDTPEETVYYKKDNASNWTTAIDSVSITLDNDSIAHTYKYYCQDNAENVSPEHQSAVTYPIPGRWTGGDGVTSGQGLSNISQALQGSTSGIPNLVIAAAIVVGVIYFMGSGKKKRKRR